MLDVFGGNTVRLGWSGLMGSADLHFSECAIRAVDVSLHAAKALFLDKYVMHVSPGRLILPGFALLCLTFVQCFHSRWRRSGLIVNVNRRLGS